VSGGRPFLQEPDARVDHAGADEQRDFVTAPSEFPALGVPSLHLETAFDKRIPIYPGTRSAQTGYVFCGMAARTW